MENKVAPYPSGCSKVLDYTKLKRSQLCTKKLLNLIVLTVER